MSTRIINRHRPLRPGELRARFRRLRREAHPDQWCEDEPWNRRWGIEELVDGHGCGHHDAPEPRYWWRTEAFERLLGDLSRRIGSAGSLTYRLPGLPGLPAVEPAGAIDPGDLCLSETSLSETSRSETSRSEGAVEQRLAEHLLRLPTLAADDLLHGDDTADDLRCLHQIADRQLPPLCDFTEDHELDRDDGRYRVGTRQWRHARDPLVAISLFRPFWIRSPRTWRASSDATAAERVASLLEHVFGRFPFPRFLHEAWLVPLTSLDLRWLAWTITLAQGGSLRRLHRLVHQTGRRGFEPLPKKFPGFLHRVPSHCSLREGPMYAEVLRLGGTPEELHRLSLDPSYAIDPTACDTDLDDRRFWEGAVRWLCRHRETLEQLGDGACAQILGWARHRHTERGYGPFDWSGRSPRATLEQARAYRRIFHARHRGLRWPARGWDRAYAVGGAGWTFEELTTSEALAEESEAMSHCVRSYDRYCAYGRSAIFSARCEGRRRLTVEVYPATAELAQVVGPCNRRPSALEQGIVDRWIDEAVRGEAGARPSRGLDAAE